MSLKQRYLLQHKEIMTLRNTIAALPPGYLRKRQKNGHTCFEHRYSMYNKKRCHYIKLKEAPQIQDGIERRKELEYKLKELIESQLQIEEELYKLGIHPADILAEDHNQYLQWLQKQEQHRIEKMDAESDPFQNRKHIANCGIRPRSKSETLIMNLLSANNITFYYEKPLTLPDGSIIWPDFTIVLPDRTIYWEHVGKTSDPNYMADWWHKHKRYIEAGFREGKDLIVTYEYDTFDSIQIQKLIDLYLK